jgi:hypothetical protein
MKELRSILGLLVLLVGAFVLYKVLPAYWADYKLGRLLEEEAVAYTYKPAKNDKDIPAALAEKARGLGVELVPEEITVDRSGAELAIIATYTVHVELPVYPLDLNFKTGTKNHDVMK